ncbi:MAG TPA: type II toxin-antitoxin system VapC family toxin [Chiayiivirga sp.]|nr:type II toxin-antitoxin system VapC family toxin [Chiayiivirga sp.]
MRMPDLNVLLYAVNADARQQATAARWLEDAYAEAAGIGFAWVVILGFLRIATRPGIFARALTLDEALAQVDEWLAHPRARLIHPGERHPALLARLLIGAGHGGDLVTDAHLAALAIEHGATLGSFDRDFHRFPGLQLDALSDTSIHER